MQISKYTTERERDGQTGRQTEKERRGERGEERERESINTHMCIYTYTIQVIVPYLLYIYMHVYTQPLRTNRMLTQGHF